MVFLLPNSVTSERRIALLPTLFVGGRCLRAAEVSKGKKGIGLIGELFRAEWRSVAQVWETVLDMERFDHCANEKDQGAITVLLDVADACERVSLPVVSAGATHFNLPMKILHLLRWYFEHQRRVQFTECVAEAIPAIFLGSKWSCLLFCTVLRDALSEVMEVRPLLKLKVFVGHITAFMEGQTKSCQVLRRR